MSRHSRITLPQQPHHVITRGNNRRRLFSYPSDYLRFLAYLHEALDRTGCSLHAVTLMSNHVHAVITPPTAEALAALVARSSQRYAAYRNQRRDASGKLFEQRFVSIPILDDSQLGVTTVYTDLNAVRAGMVADAADYGWSTYSLHAGEPARSRIDPAMWRPSEWYLALGRDVPERADRYRELAQTYAARGEKPRQVGRAEIVEAVSRLSYTKRLERPDRTRAL